MPFNIISFVHLAEVPESNSGSNEAHVHVWHLSEIMIQSDMQCCDSFYSKQLRVNALAERTNSSNLTLGVLAQSFPFGTESQKIVLAKHILQTI